MKIRSHIVIQSYKNYPIKSLQLKLMGITALFVNLCTCEGPEDVYDERIIYYTSIIYILLHTIQ